MIVYTSIFKVDKIFLNFAFLNMKRNHHLGLVFLDMTIELS